MPWEGDKSEIYFGDLEFISNFADADRIPQRPGRGQKRGGDAKTDIIESVYLTLFLDGSELRNFYYQCQECSNSRCLVGMYIRPVLKRESVSMLAYSYSAWGLCIARSTLVGNAKASNRWTSNSKVLALFLYSGRTWETISHKNERNSAHFR